MVKNIKDRLKQSKINNTVSGAGIVNTLKSMNPFKKSKPKPFRNLSNNTITKPMLRDTNIKNVKTVIPYLKSSYSSIPFYAPTDDSIQFLIDFQENLLGILNNRLKENKNVNNFGWYLIQDRDDGNQVKIICDIVVKNDEKEIAFTTIDDLKKYIFLGINYKYNPAPKLLISNPKYEKFYKSLKKNFDLKPSPKKQKQVVVGGSGILKKAMDSIYKTGKAVTGTVVGTVAKTSSGLASSVYDLGRTTTKPLRKITAEEHIKDIKNTLDTILNRSKEEVVIILQQYIDISKCIRNVVLGESSSENLDILVSNILETNVINNKESNVLKVSSKVLINKIALSVNKKLSDIVSSVNVDLGDKWEFGIEDSLWDKYYFYNTINSELKFFTMDHIKQNKFTSISVEEKQVNNNINSQNQVIKKGLRAIKNSTYSNQIRLDNVNESKDILFDVLSQEKDLTKFFNNMNCVFLNKKFYESLKKSKINIKNIRDKREKQTVASLQQHNVNKINQINQINQNTTQVKESSSLVRADQLQNPTTKPPKTTKPPSNTSKFRTMTI